MSTANSSRLVRALGLSLLAHALVLTASGRPGAVTPVALAAFEPIAVTLAGLRLPQSAPATAVPAAASAAVARPTAASPPDAATADRGPATDEPDVEARSDVAALNNPKPPYPLAARRQGIEGRVLLAVQVRADGSCAHVQLQRSSGHAQLDDAALTTVRRWRFRPAQRAGVAIDSWVEVPVSFRLNG